MLKDKIISFWLYSEQRTHHFDFQGFFEEYKTMLAEKLALHGLLGFEYYITSVSRIYQLEKLTEFVHTTHDGIDFDYGSILKAIFQPRYKHYRNIYIGNNEYKALALLYGELCETENLEHTELVLLVDKCIHAEHNSGFLVDIENLRKSYEASLCQK